jgi:hypothetical protein
MMRALAVLLCVLILSACENNGFGPAVATGDHVPGSNNRLITEGESWRDICSMDTPDGLHNWRIADLLSERRPFMVVFGTPQHCTMCVDQLVRVAALQEKYGERFAVVHVDGYRDNPVWVEWGIKGEPWTFIVDNSGVVRKIFPGPTDAVLMEQVIEEILGEIT